MSTTARTPVHPDQTSRVATAVWLAVSSVTFAVWLIVSFVHGAVETPWFLYSLVGGGAVVASIHGATRGSRR